MLKGGNSSDKAKSTSTKFVPEDETSEQRDARTIFVGNVAVEVAKSRVRPLVSHIYFSD